MMVGGLVIILVVFLATVKSLDFGKKNGLETDTLKNLYPDLYLKSYLQNGFVPMMGSLVHNVWVWRFDWIDSLSDSEAALEQELLNLLLPFQPSLDVEDRNRWISSSAGIFSVKSAYIDLLNRSVMTNLEDSMVHSLKLMWKNNVPSKISIFGWRLFSKNYRQRRHCLIKELLLIVLTRTVFFVPIMVNPLPMFSFTVTFPLMFGAGYSFGWD
jgi:hypothetical protein